MGSLEFHRTLLGQSNLISYYTEANGYVFFAMGVYDHKKKDEKSNYNHVSCKIMLFYGTV